MWKIFIPFSFFISITDAYEISHYSYKHNEDRNCFIEHIDNYRKHDSRPYITFYENIDGKGRNLTADEYEIPSLRDFLEGRKFGKAKLLCLNSLWLVYPNEHYNEEASDAVWIVTGFHCFDFEQSKIGSIQRFAEHPQWLPEEITFFQEPIFQGRMRKFGKHDGFVYHNNEENEAACGIYKSAIITGSTSWLIPLRKPEEPRHRHQTRYCFSPSPSKDVDDYTISKKDCSSPELNTLEDGDVFRFCGHRPPPDSPLDSQDESSSSDHNSYNDASNEMFFAFPNFPDSIFNEFFPLEQDVNQQDYGNLMVPYELDESSGVETTKSKRSIGPDANVLSMEKVKAIESPVITIHDKPDLGKLFICILEDTTSVSAPKGLAWDDDGDGPKECEPECNNLFMHTQLNITNCFRYGLAFQIQNMNSRKPNFCSVEGTEGVTNLNSTDNTVGSGKLHSNRDGKTSPLHPTRERKSYSKMLRLLQQKIEFDVRESLTRSDNNRVQPRLKSQFTTKNSLRQSYIGGVDGDSVGDMDEGKQNDSKDSSNGWEQSWLNVMLDILMKKCDQQWIPRDFLKLLNKLSMFFAQEVEMSRRGRLARIARKQMEYKMNNNSKSVATNNTTESSTSSNNDTLGNVETPKLKLRMTMPPNEMPPNEKDNLHATTVRPSIAMPFWKEIDTMLQDCLNEVNKSGEPLDLSAETGEPNVVKYYRQSWKGVGQRRTFGGPARSPLITYSATLDEMLSQQLDPVLEFLWQTYSLVYASCIPNNSFNSQVLIFAKFSTGFKKFFLTPVITFWKTMDPDLLLQHKDSIYNHLFSGYNYTLMVHNVKACAQAVYLQENVELLPKPSGIY